MSRLRRVQGKKPPTAEEMQREYEQGIELWKKEQGWNPTPFRTAPWQIRGLNPVTREPWFEDMAVCTRLPEGRGDGEGGGLMGSGAACAPPWPCRCAPPMLAAR
jgi:hypothetical protein